MSRKPSAKFTREPRTLSEWVAFLEEGGRNPIYQKLEKVLSQFASAPRVSPVLPPTIHKVGDKLRHDEMVKELLEKLWSDGDFWREASSAQNGEILARYIQSKFELMLPVSVSGREMSPSVWFQMVRFPQLRTRFIELLEGGFAKTDSQFRSDYSRVVQKQLRKKNVGEIFLKYVNISRRVADTDEPAFSCTVVDRRHFLASQGLSKESLFAIAAAARQLADEARWCSRNFGEIPPRLANRPKCKPRSLDRVRLVEKMVARLRTDQSLTAYRLATESLSDAEELLANNRDGPQLLDRTKKIAQEALLVARFREKLPVRLPKMNLNLRRSTP